MAAIDGISSLSSSSSASSYQAKPTTEVKSVESVSSTSTSVDATVASQVVTVKSKDNSDGAQMSNDKQGTASNEQIKKAVDALNKKMTGTVCEYGYHDETKRVTIKIVNKDTKEVIKEYPAEETLDMIAKAWELAGLMVDKKL